MLRHDGFPGQRLRVLPVPLSRQARARPVTQRLLVTDAGYFPRAAAHGRIRPAGAAEAIVIVCTHGGGWVMQEGRRFPVASGDAVVLPPDRAHSYLADEDDPWTIWWLHATGTDVPELVTQIRGPEDDPVVHLHDVFTAVALIEQAVALLEADETTGTLLRASGAAWHLLAILAADRLRRERHTADRIHVVQEYLRDNLSSAVPVSELARLAELSTSHFSALFKASTGYSVVDYLKRLRSARARELLVTTDLSIAEIAAQVGYSDAFYFSRQFRAINGTSPTQFRDASRQHMP